MFRQTKDMTFFVRQIWTKGDGDFPEFNNVFAYYIGDFIVVAKSENDPEPKTWINTNEVVIMKGVQVI